MSVRMLAGVVPSGTPRPETAPEHHRIEHGALIGLAFDVDDRPLPEAEDAERTLAWADRQMRLLCAYVETADVLPVALGAAFSSTDAIAENLADRGAAFGTLLRPLIGHVELALHLGQCRDSAPRRTPSGVGGRRFLEARQKRRNARRDRAMALRSLVEGIDDALRTCASEVRHRDPTREDRIADWSVLVPRDRLTACARALETPASLARGEGAAVRLIGPLPAFSFCEEAVS